MPANGENCFLEFFFSIETKRVSLQSLVLERVSLQKSRFFTWKSLKIHQFLIKMWWNRSFNFLENSFDRWHFILMKKIKFLHLIWVFSSVYRAFWVSFVLSKDSFVTKYVWPFHFDCSFWPNYIFILSKYNFYFNLIQIKNIN